MFFNIDPANGLAIYEQVVRQVVFAVAAGGLATRGSRALGPRAGPRIGDQS